MPKRKRKKEDGPKSNVHLLAAVAVAVAVKFKGVSKCAHGKKFRAYIVIDGKQQHLGTFDTPKEAAKARDGAAIKARRPTSTLNFLDQVPKNYKPKKKKRRKNFSPVDKVGFRFRARIYIDGKQRSVGTFGTEKEATEAYKQAALQARTG